MYTYRFGILFSIFLNFLQSYETFYYLPNIFVTFKVVLIKFSVKYASPNKHRFWIFTSFYNRLCLIQRIAKTLVIAKNPLLVIVPFWIVDVNHIAHFGFAVIHTAYRYKLPMVDIHACICKTAIRIIYGYIAHTSERISETLFVVGYYFLYHNLSPSCR